MCGEKIPITEADGPQKGSPPHVRGKAVLHEVGRRGLGITPACAGKRLWPVRVMPLHMDHPRMCGEKKLRRRGTSCCLGSPPHVRGKALRKYWQTNSAGITPACAGKSMMQSRTATAARDHPRMCGEKSSGCRMYSVVPGSPPHVRGKD